jgi:thioredoxin-related protein
MKKYFSIFVIIMCLFIFACTTGEEKNDSGRTGVAFETLSLQDALASAQNQNKLIMIDFFSPT